MNTQEQWLAVDTAIRKLKRLNYWVTSLDPEKPYINKAIEELEQVKRLLEEK